jgi:hypothetical protein
MAEKGGGNLIIKRLGLYLMLKEDETPSFNVNILLGCSAFNSQFSEREIPYGENTNCSFYFLDRRRLVSPP